ncbi:ATP-dependent DNA ligase [Micromonospora rhizosphaerae]|uniref:ATP-dependent DNA ligase n=1 Tax=Micromonospora rhizosphaerae TaxID=568872 RepID=A0A1C6T371_9ACTN|nr:ATP-dependent DNA ligase [Micromonospora rhizosphaerae]SCL36270.1 ATP-dependent DNA ligase [Micromonospora rhizosphaerae]
MTPAPPRASAAAAPVLRRPVAPMLAAPVDAVPEGPGLVHEPKWDGWRAIAFRETDGVYLQSRAGRNLTTYFPDITRAIRTAIPPGVVLDGELIVWERGRTNFAQLQRRVTAGRALLRLARECPAHYVLFDLLAEAGGQVILDLPLSERRARLEQLLAGAPAQLTLTPQTADMRQVSDWLLHWTVAAGIEGVVSKRLAGRYEPGRRGWSKFRTRIVTEAIVGGVTGSISSPETVLLGRFDRRGRLRYTGRTHPLTTIQAVELAALLAPPRLPRRGVVAHPWQQPLPASWSGQLDQPEPLRYVQVEPTVVAEIEADVAFEHQRWRHRVRYARARTDMSVYDVPLLLGEGEDPFGTPSG